MTGFDTLYFTIFSSDSRNEILSGTENELKSLLMDVAFKTISFLKVLYNGHWSKTWVSSSTIVLQ